MTDDTNVEDAAKEIVQVQKAYAHERSNVISQRRQRVRQVIDRYIGGSNETTEN